MLEVLTNAEKASGDVVFESEVLDCALDRRGCFGGAIVQPRTVADFGVETLAGCQSFFSAALRKRPEADDVFIDEREQVERHLSPMRSMS